MSNNNTKHVYSAKHLYTLGTILHNVKINMSVYSKNIYLTIPS